MGRGPHKVEGRPPDSVHAVRALGNLQGSSNTLPKGHPGWCRATLRGGEKGTVLPTVFGSFPRASSFGSRSGAISIASGTFWSWPSSWLAGVPWRCLWRGPSWQRGTSRDTGNIRRSKWLHLSPRSQHWPCLLQLCVAQGSKEVLKISLTLRGSRVILRNDYSYHLDSGLWSEAYGVLGEDSKTK